MTDTGAGLRKYARELEESFFERENRRLLEKMRAEAEKERKRERLRAALKIDDDALLDRFIELDLCPETVMALGLVPLVFAAWADGEIQSREREAILRAAAERSIPVDSDNYRMLRDWLEHRPGTYILSFVPFADRLARLERRNALPRLVISDYDNAESFEIEAVRFLVGARRGF